MSKLLAIISILMIAAGAVNHGFTHFWLVVPFMVYLVTYLIYSNYPYNKFLIVISLIYISLSILISLNREKIPLLYPIIQGGEIITIANSYNGYGLKKTSNEFETGGSYGFDESELESSFRFLSDSEKLALENFKNDPLQTSIIVTHPLKGVQQEENPFVTNNTNTNGDFILKVVKENKKGDVLKVLKMHHKFPLAMVFIIGIPQESISLETSAGTRQAYNQVYGQFSSISSDHLIGPDRYMVGGFTVVNKEIISPWSVVLSDIMPLYLVYIFMTALVLKMIAFIFRKYKK